MGPAETTEFWSHTKRIRQRVCLRALFLGVAPWAKARPRPYAHRGNMWAERKGAMPNLARRARTRRSGVGSSRCSFVRVGVLLAVVVGVGVNAPNASLATSRMESSSASSAGSIFQGTVQAVFKHLLHAHLRPVPRWPAYLPAPSRHGRWEVYGIRGLESGCCADPLASGPTAYRVDFSYGARVRGGSIRAGFGRTTARGFHDTVRFSRRNCAPPRDMQLGGREVTEFCYPSTIWWGFLGPGGAYLFYTHVYGEMPLRVIARMIASLRPITQLRPPS